MDTHSYYLTLLWEQYAWDYDERFNGHTAAEFSRKELYGFLLPYARLVKAATSVNIRDDRPTMDLWDIAARVRTRVEQIRGIPGRPSTPMLPRSPQVH